MLSNSNIQQHEKATVVDIMFIKWWLNVPAVRMIVKKKQINIDKYIET